MGSLAFSSLSLIGGISCGQGGDVGCLGIVFFSREERVLEACVVTSLLIVLSSGSQYI